ncbi:MAG: hypothetical protein AAGI53_11775 [Planctomycetota bacterium]
MSAESCVVFFGVRYEVAPHEIEGLELRTDSRVIIARDVRLQWYWGTDTVLFIGKQIAIMGIEGDLRVQVAGPELNSIMSDVRAKLSQARLDGEPMLHCEWQEDL